MDHRPTGPPVRGPNEKTPVNSVNPMFQQHPIHPTSTILLAFRLQRNTNSNEMLLRAARQNSALSVASNNSPPFSCFLCVTSAPWAYHNPQHEIWFGGVSAFLVSVHRSDH